MRTPFCPRHWRWLVIVITLLLANVVMSPALNAGQGFTRLSTDDIRSLGGVFAIAQDRQGFIWFGGKNGIRRYDGYQFREFRHDLTDPTTLASNDVSDLLVDREGRLWIGLLSGGGLNRFDFDAETFIQYPLHPQDADQFAHQSVYNLAEDARGNLWLATHDSGLLKLDHATGRFSQYDGDTLGLRDNSIRDLAIDPDGGIWLASMSDGLHRFDPETGETRHFRTNPAEPELGPSGNRLYRLYIDRFDNVWIGTKFKGLSRFDPQSQTFIHFRHDPDDPNSIGNGMIWDIQEESTGDLWIATRDGALNRFDKWGHQFQRYYPEEFHVNGLSGPVISLFSDNTGDLWLGTYNSEVNRMIRRLPQFSVLQHHPADTNSLLSNTVNVMFEDSHHHIWIGSERGLTRTDAARSSYAHFRRRPDANIAVPGAAIKSLAETPDGHLWIGTLGEGLFSMSLTDGPSDCHRSDHSCQAISIQPLKQIPARHIWSLYGDREGILWVGSQQQGLFRYDPEADTLEQYLPRPDQPGSISHEYVWDILEDSEGRLWIATQEGLNRLESSTGRFVTYTQARHGLSNNSIRALAEDQEGWLWLGTASGATRFNPETSEIVVYRTVDGLPDDNVTAVVVDDTGFVWLTTQKGLSRFDPESRTFSHFDTRHGIAGNAHPRKASAISLHTGEIWFGSTGGITAIHPDQIRRNHLVPPIVLTGLQLAGRPVDVGPAGPLRTAISRTASLRLPHPNPVFSIEFAALDYVVPTQNQYAYRLSGFDEEWNLTSARHRLATYTNLSPGHYTLQVKGSNNEGVWNEQPTQLNIYIMPPWWRTSWAYIGYLLLVVSVVWYWWYLQNQRMILERNARQRAQQADQFKNHLISNLSRELNAPLMAINGISENLLSGGGGELSGKGRENVELILAQSTHLTGLVKDLLDFGGDPQFIVLNRSTVYIDAVIESVMAHFQDQAKQQGLRLYSNLDGHLVPIQADDLRLRQVLVKLISNALRFTGQGYIEVNARREGEWLVISVKDTGVGMDQKQCDRLWDSERINSSARRGAKSDLTMPAIRRIVQMHGGEMTVESIVHEGSTFSFTLPVG